MLLSIDIQSHILVNKNYIEFIDNIKLNSKIIEINK